MLCREHGLNLRHKIEIKQSVINKIVTYKATMTEEALLLYRSIQQVKPKTDKRLEDGTRNLQPQSHPSLPKFLNLLTF